MSWERIYEDAREEVVSLVRAGMEDTGPYYSSSDWNELIGEYEAKIRKDERERIAAWLRKQSVVRDEGTASPLVLLARMIEEDKL